MPPLALFFDDGDDYGVRVGIGQTLSKATATSPAILPGPVRPRTRPTTTTNTWPTYLLSPRSPQSMGCMSRFNPYSAPIQYFLQTSEFEDEPSHFIWLIEWKKMEIGVKKK